MAGITKRQKQIFNFIKEFIAQNSFSPSYKEIMQHCELSSLGSVYKHIQALKRKGLLTTEKHCSRSMKIIEVLPRIIELPFLGYASKGKALVAVSSSEKIAVPMHCVVNPHITYVIRAEDNSFCDNHINAHDLLIVEAANKANPKDMILALLYEKETHIKQYMPLGPLCKLEDANPHSCPLIIDAKNVVIQGIIRAILRYYMKD